IDLIALNTVFHGIMARIPPSTMSEAAAMLPRCKVPKDLLQKMAESVDFEQAAAMLKYTDYGEAVEEGSPSRTLRTLRRMLRLRIWREANTVINGIPFHAGYIVAGLEASRIEAEDLVTIIVGKRSGLSPEEIAEYVVVSE
ncbi:MAG: V-type ATPase subunit, partial [Candidatus Korarchaeota archaeon]|nr:V-type ATPase subunit [Candidatus Korarchaeota archaeon]